jgi:hypothetical protein
MKMKKFKDPSHFWLPTSEGAPIIEKSEDFVIIFVKLKKWQLEFI